MEIIFISCFTFAVILVLIEFGIDGIPYNKEGT